MSKRLELNSSKKNASFPLPPRSLSGQDFWGNDFSGFFSRKGLKFEINYFF